MQLNQQVDEKRWNIRTTVGVGSEPRDAGLQVSLQKQEVEWTQWSWKMWRSWVGSTGD